MKKKYLISIFILIALIAFVYIYNQNKYLISYQLDTRYMYIEYDNKKDEYYLVKNNEIINIPLKSDEFKISLNQNRTITKEWDILIEKDSNIQLIDSTIFEPFEIKFGSVKDGEDNTRRVFHLKLLDSSILNNQVKLVYGDDEEETFIINVNFNYDNND